ncbi:hypothetical protein K8I28_00440 [bacterium]|nr:hypothetical protein [bacterium]
MKRLFFVSIILLCMAGTFVSAQEPSRKYERKSISYIKSIYLASPSARKINQQQTNILVDEFKEYIHMSRFDYNQLPDRLITQFVEVANSRERLSVDELGRLMERYIVPEIMKVLNATMQVRAGELVDEAEKQQFLASKAKEIGITLEEIEKVMNSAYLYLPIITKYTVEEKKGGKFEVNLEGGIIWYQVVNDGEKAKIRLRLVESTTSLGFGSREFAFESAAMNFARNLKRATQEMPEFKLSAPVTEVIGGKVSFPMGTKEGVGLDNCFYVGEFVESGSDVKFKKNGWILVNKVADNKKNEYDYSRGFAIKKGNWTPGMTVVEHPRLGIDIALKPGVFRTRVTSGNIPVLAGEVQITEDYENMAPGLDLDAHINIANLTNTNQLFFLIGGNLALPTGIEFNPGPGYYGIFTNLTTSSPFIWGLHGGLLKKFYARQLSFTLAAKGGVQFFSVSQKFNFLDYEVDFEMSNNTVGVQFDAGIDYAFTPNFNLGIMAGYRAYPESQVWTYTVTTDDDSESGSLPNPSTGELPRVNHSGMVIAVYMHFSPPALSFDPASMVQGMLGR